MQALPPRARSGPSRKSVLCWLAAGLLGCAASTASAQTIPSDPEASCTVPAATFASWFQSGTPALDGVVNPANSVSFPNTPNCSFYQWSRQMFLWLTSPAPITYGGGGGRIFSSPIFFDVSPPDASDVRTFIPHASGLFHIFNVRAAQLGPHALPVVFDTSGRLFEVSRTVTPLQSLQIRDVTGKQLTVVHAKRDPNGGLQLLDKGGKPVQFQRPVLKPLVAGAIPILTTKSVISATLRKVLIDGLPIFVDPAGNVIDVEQGQADFGVMQAQNGSLVYYATTVNDVYAYFLTGVKDHAISPGTQFPTTMTELNAISAFAASHGKTFPDASALAVEVKSSWVDASTLTNASDYITTKGTVPTYDTSNPALWVPNGQKTITLAMVGMHVVGSTAGHPEMIWATFEHFGNTPNGAYSYVNNHGAVAAVAQDTSGSWLFAHAGSTGPFNQTHMQQSGANIAALSPFTISPSDTIRWKAFGAGSDHSPNPISGSAAASNSEIISIQNSVMSQMPSGDVRNQYYMTGATWTIGGASPNASNQVGTSALANSTMETYQQGSDNTVAHGFSNCFSCHGSNTTSVSHVFPGLKPLF